MSGDDEIDALKARYARRASLPPDRYAADRPDVAARTRERRERQTVLLSRHLPRPLADCQVLEIGCGHGGNLLEWLADGLPASQLAGIELLPDRLAAARERLPDAVRLWPGDARRLALPEASVDVVQLSTVFSSILDDQVQAELAAAAWRWLRPGGGVLWYDFTVNNPRNRDVRGVPMARLQGLFGAGHLDAQRLTLAPPLARAACALHPALYGWLNRVPGLHTHVLAWIGKPE